MRNFPSVITLSLLSLPIFAQETSEEGVLVTGSRIPFESAGIIAMSGSPIDTTGAGCAEPNCGMGPEDPSGGRYLTIAAKNQQNKKAKQKLLYTQIFCQEAFNKIEQHAKETLVATESGDTLRIMLSALKKFTRHTPVNVIALKRDASVKLIDAEKYIV